MVKRKGHDESYFNTKLSPFLETKEEISRHLPLCNNNRVVEAVIVCWVAVIVFNEIF